MKSLTTGKALYGVYTKDTSTVNLAFGVEVANDKYRHICSKRDWPFLERLRTLLTTTSQFVNLPYDCDQVREVAVIVSSIRHVPKLCPSREMWDKLNQSTATSDIPEYYFVFAGQLGLWPIPATAGNTINVTQKSRVIDLAAADYTTGTIVSITNGATALVGSGTTWTSQMVGRYIKITPTDAAGTGDGVWYEISAVPTATTITLVRAYGGTTIAAGSAAYTIGQMVLLPEAFHDTLWKGAAADYWAKEADNRATFYQAQFDAEIKELERVWSSPTTNMVIDNGDEHAIINPNLTIQL